MSARPALRLLLSAALLWPASLSAQGAQITATASVGRAELGVGQQFILTVEIGGTRQLERDPQLPDMSAFANVLGSGMTTSMQTVNGRTTVSLIIQYRLQATATGSHEIGPIAISAFGTTVRTAPVAITVTDTPPPVARSRGAPSADLQPQTVGPEDVFVTAEASAATVLQNEPVIVEYRIYTRVNVTSYSVSRLPSAPGFWVEEFELPAQPEVEPITLNGQRYVTAIIRKVALFPTSPGTRTVEPMEIEAQVRLQRQSRDPVDDLFRGILDRSSIFGSEVAAAAVSQPIEVEVLPLPTAGRPSTFSGMVGDLEVTSSIDRDSVAANEAVTMTVEVSGTGNLNAIALPELDLPPTIEAFPPETSDRLRTTERGVTGTRTYEFVLIPRASGVLDIPGIDVGYFDPDAGEYRVASAAPIDLTVTGRAGDAAIPGSRARGEVEALRTDIRFIEIDTPRFERVDRSPLSSGLLWLVLLAPLGAVGGAAGWRRHRDRLAGDIGLARSRRAGRVAKKRLAKARELAAGSDARAFYAEAGQALEGFIADRLNVAAAGMIRDEIRPALECRGATGETITECLDCLEACDRQRFAPAGSSEADRSAFLGRVEAAMSALDGELE